MPLPNTTMTLGEGYVLNRPRASSPYPQETGDIAYKRIKHDLERTIEGYRSLYDVHGNNSQNRIKRLKLVATRLKREIQLESNGSIRFSLDKLISSVYKNQPSNKKATRTLKSRTKGDLVTILHGSNMAVTEEVGRSIVSYRLSVSYSIHNGLEFGYFYRRRTGHANRQFKHAESD